MLLALTLGGCAFVPQDVQLNPSVTFRPADIGAGREVQVRILDGRPSEVFGRKISGYGAAAAIRGSSGNTHTVFRSTVFQILENQAFVPQDEAAESVLRLEICSISIEAGQTLFAFDVRSTAAIKALGDRGGRIIYERFYRGHS